MGEYLDKVTNQIEAYKVALTETKERLEDVNGKVKNALRDGHTVDKIRDKENMAADVEEALSVDLDRFVLASKATLVVKCT